MVLWNYGPLGLLFFEIMVFWDFGSWNLVLQFWDYVSLDSWGLQFFEIRILWDYGSLGQISIEIYGSLGLYGTCGL